VIGKANRISGTSYESLLQFALQQIQDQFPDHCQLQQLQLGASPTLVFSLQPDKLPMIQLTQEFEFSASHRLHNPDLSDEENRQLFGKCNNPHGHGHNYVVRVTVEGAPGDDGVVIGLPQLEATVKQHVINPMDHRNLNVELNQFRQTNPTVENIACAIWDMLQPAIQAIPQRDIRLHQVRVYETPKTWADCQGTD